MSTGTYVVVKELPEAVKGVLKSIGFGKVDIQMRASETVSVGQGGGDGRRSFYAIIALDGSVDPKIEYGSWGGANPFETKRVDHDHQYHPIAPGFAVVVGSEAGGTRVYCTMHVHPSNFVPLLPPKATINSRLRSILRDFSELTSAGRKNKWNSDPVGSPTVEEIAELVGLGLLNRSKNGATSITTSGKNATRGEVSDGLPS